jgi:hypothetical protein
MLEGFWDARGVRGLPEEVEGEDVRGHGGRLQQSERTSVLATFVHVQVSARSYSVLMDSVHPQVVDGFVLETHEDLVQEVLDELLLQGPAGEQSVQVGTQ